ncbi:outer membrane beta-barrel protein [Campylobacter sp. 19-13652]|uniref:outer membrane beta-barrel protein n=1 Tax=Campylobacter sp. 19-13652 TaxID=2840180 RepID=UPI001C77823D|nr:outer membrane beta-barrel protein [Campylobacter sp. 19-13652]BCX79914.1 hypothetical protein LBC_13760 [Campylobacter sp. 19-13652]
MKKLLITSVAALALASQAMANGAFMGVGADYSLSTKLKFDGDSDSIKKAQPGISLKAGYDFGIMRAYGQYDYRFKFKKEVQGVKYKYDSHRFIVGADFTPSLSDSFKLAVGAYTGVTKSKLKVEDLEGDSANGWLIGAKLGGLYEINEHNELDFGFKFDTTKFKDARETSPAIYLGYNFKF